MSQQNDTSPSVPKSAIPKDSQVMAAILKEMGVDNYEPRVLNQMLEFTYRYVSNVIDDAQLYANHAKKKQPDADDVNLAISLMDERNFTYPPSRDVTAELARQRNSIPLPAIKSGTSLRLPADRYSMTACNYRLKSTKKTRVVHTVSRLNVANLSQTPGNKGSPAIATLTKSTPMTTKLVLPSTPVTSRQVVTLEAKPSPIIKFTDGNRIAASTSLLAPMPATISSPMPVATPANLPTVGIMNADLNIKAEILSQKRKHEDDYDME